MADWILSSSALVLLVLLLRSALRKRLDPRLRYALWLLALLRLLCPLPLFESALSLPGLAERAVEQAAPAELPAEEPQGAVYAPSAPLPAESAAAPAPAGHEAQAPRHFSAGSLLRGLWAAGALALLGAALAGNLRFGAALRRGARPLPGIWTAPPRRIYISAAPGTPCLFGLSAPAIYVSEDLAVNDRALGHALSHERAHYRHGDPLWALLRLLALALHWYNPLVWLACALSRQDAEAAADASAIAALGEKERLDYGETLVGLAAGPRRPLLLGTTMSASRRWLRARLAQILRQPRTALPALLLVLVCAALAVRLAYAGPVRESPALAPTPSPVPVTAPAEQSAPEPMESAAPAERTPLVTLSYGGKLYTPVYKDGITSGPLCYAREPFGHLTAPAGAAPQADLEVSDPALTGLTLRRYSNAAVPHGLCVEQEGELLVFKALEDLTDWEHGRVDILSSQEAFTAWLRLHETNQDYTALSPEEYAAAYELPLAAPAEGMGFESLGQVWVHQDPTGGTDLLTVTQVFYNYPLGAAVFVYQNNGHPQAENFFCSTTNELGEPLSETERWAWFRAGNTPAVETGSLRFLLFSAYPLEEAYCRALLTPSS